MTLRFSDAYENGGLDNPYAQSTRLWYEWEGAGAKPGRIGMMTLREQTARMTRAGQKRF